MTQPIHASPRQTLDGEEASSSSAHPRLTRRRPTLQHRSDPVVRPPYPRSPWPISGTIVIDENQRSVFGGFNEVIQGDHDFFGRVALRRSTDSDYDQSLARVLAMEVWKSLDHPRILQLLGTYEHKRYTYTVSRWAEHGTVMEYLEKYPSAPRRPLLIDAARGILYMHEKGIIHGDIKPDNLLVTADHHVQLCDFDLARSMSSTTHPVIRGAGSFRYQAPELWLTPNKRRSAKTDVYAFGMTIYEVLSGKLPFHDLNEGGVVLAVAAGKRPPQEPESPESNESYEYLWKIAKQCWDPDPARRPSMKEVEQRL
ncbi:hypothetical protein FRB99_001433, partial [Tulasnella sp. 403]